MDTLRIGQIIKFPRQRDAVHMAVVPVAAGSRLKPGDHVGMDGDKATRKAESIGIVDPFLREDVSAGEQFWLFLYPGSITSLRHDWTHPAFLPENAPSIDTALSEKWLRKFAEEHEAEYEDLMWACANSTEDGGSYLPGISEGISVPDQLWDHYGVIVGKVIPERNRASYFSCSC